MIKINDELITNIPVGIILTDDKGKILKVNKSARNILKTMNLVSITSIYDLDAKFCSKVLKDTHKVEWHYCIDGFMLDVNVHKVKYENDRLCYLYIFNDYKYKMNEMSTIFECIDDVVLIVNKDKILEKINKAFDRLTGLDGKSYVGKNIYKLKDKGVMKQSVILNVFERKKTVIMNVKYKNGSIVTYTGIPIFDRKNEVVKVIATGRNITQLVNLEARLKETEKQKEKYFTKLKRLEECLGKNDIIYSSDKMKQVINVAIKAAKTDSSIFIKGESGVGKEEIAKFIHKNSKRKDKIFTAINCAAIPSELLESEFFGYEEGAFTGAKKGGKKGLFEESNGGTIFLDEIGELNIQMQTKLLRVLQENTIMRVGGSELISIDVRYICATNLSKKQLSDNSKFRQDLYYRLSVVPISIPPLRERREDIFPLIYNFLNYYNNKYNRKIKFNKNVMKLLYNYNWYGNVRELKNVIERFVILADEDIINESEFDIVTQLEDKDDQNEEAEISIKGLMDLNDAYKIVDTILIERALKESGTITRAAKVLGIDPSTIHRKLKKGMVILNK